MSDYKGKIVAKAEFYEIIIQNKNDSSVANINIIETIKKRLSYLSDDDLLCNHGTCLGLVSDLKENEDSATFDFSKLTHEVINSTIISNPSHSIDTFEEFNKMESNNSNPTTEETEYIIKISSEYKDKALIKKLMDSDIEYFTIYKILTDNDGLISSDELNNFCDKTIKRMRKEKIFFNILKLENKNYRYLLIFQKATHGFDIGHLQEYLNIHLLLQDNIKIYFKQIYDMQFMQALQNADIKNFKFSYHEESKNNLLDSDFASALYFITKHIGDSVTISVKNKHDMLNNKNLLHFFTMASEAGLLETCKIKKAGTSKEISSTSDGLELSYINKQPINNIEEANNFFLESFQNKKNDIADRIN